MLGVSTFSMIRFDLDKLDLLLGLVLFWDLLESNG